MSERQRTIAVGFDGSKASESATAWAFAFAARTDANVVLVHAVGLREHMAHHDVPLTFAELIRSLALESGFDESRLRWLVDDGDACSVLLRVAEAPIFASLVVVGSRGHDAHAGHLLGSTSLQLAERTTIPVVIVPPS